MHSTSMYGRLCGQRNTGYTSNKGAHKATVEEHCERDAHRTAMGEDKRDHLLEEHSKLKQHLSALSAADPADGDRNAYDLKVWASVLDEESSRK
jgi:hypothetical protein